MLQPLGKLYFFDERLHVIKFLEIFGVSTSDLNVLAGISEFLCFVCFSGNFFSYIVTASCRAARKKFEKSTFFS